MTERIPNPIRFEESRSLVEFFPIDDPLAPWMFRIAIIRDDLAFEIDGLGLSADASEAEVWRCSYFIRKLCVTLFEASGLFEQQVQKYANAQCRVSPKLTDVISRARKQLVETRGIIEPIRNSLGAHIRPTYALSGEDRLLPNVEARMLASLRTEGGTVCLDFKDNRRTSFRGITRLSVFALWPNATSLEEIFDEHRKLSKALLLGGRAALHAIDIVLASYWIERKVIEVSDDYDVVLTLPKGWPHNVQFE